MRIAVSLSLVIGLLGLVLACDQSNSAPAKEPDKVVFMAGYKPQANLPFVAVYVAHEKGYFTDQDLEVEILHAASGEHLKLLVAGDIQVTTAAATSVLKRRADPELPIVAFALLGQRGQQAYVALKESGIDTLSDWEEKRFGYKISLPPDYIALMAVGEVDRSKIQEVRVGFDPRILTEGQVDILSVFKSNEPNLIRKLGHEVKLWDPSDYGVPTMGLTYITMDDIVTDNPEVLKRFLKATLKAVNDIVVDPAAAVEVTLKFAPNADRDHQLFMLESEIADAVGPVTNERNFGWMTSEQWEALYNGLVNVEALPKRFDYRTAFTTEFLDAIHDGQHLVWP